VSPDGQRALRACSGTETALVDLNDGSERRIPGATRYVSWVHIGTDGVGVVVDSRGITTVDMATGKARSLRMKEAKRAFMVQPGVLVVHRENDVEFYDVASGKRLGAALQKKVDEMTVSSRGAIATAEWNVDTSVTIWVSREKQVKIRATQKRRSRSQYLEFSPDGSRLGYFDDKILRIVDVDAGKLVHEVEEPGLGPKFYGWTLLSKDLAAALSTEDFSEPAKCEMEVSTLALTAAKPKFAKELVRDGFDGHTALGPGGLLVNRGFFLASTASGPVATPSVAWVAPPAPKKASTKAPAEKKKPKLHVPAAGLEALKSCEPAFRVLSALTELVVFAPKSSLADRPLAQAAAKALDGVVLSSDIDWDFIPCVFEGDDPRGVNVKVVKTSKKVAAETLLSDMTNIPAGSLDEYLSVAEQKAHAKAAKLLEAAGPVRQLQLKDDDEICAVLLTLARTETGSPGILSVRIDT
jgi:hypothetical protein